MNLSDKEVEEKITSFITGFLSSPHKNLGRGGKICPYVGSAVKQNRVKLAIIRGQKEKDEIFDIMMHYKEEFKKINILKPKMVMLNAIIVTFPDIELKDAHLLIDGT